MALLETEQGREIVKQVSLKKVKNWVGREGVALQAEFYLNGKKMGTFYDVADGGESDINFISLAHKGEFESFLIKNNVAQIMFDNGWDFLGVPDKIDFRSQTQELIDMAFTTLELEKEVKRIQRKIEKDCLFGIVYKKDDTSSGYFTNLFRIPLKQIVQLYKEKGVEEIQKLYDRIKLEIGERGKFLNTNLEELGIKL